MYFLNIISKLSHIGLCIILYALLLFFIEIKETKTTVAY